MDSLLEEWQVGILICLCGAFSGTLGVQLRILALDYEGWAALGLHATGWTLWIVGNIGTQVAIGLTPATLVTCGGFCGTIVFNALLAPVVLGEDLNWMHGVAVFMLCIGGTCIGCFARHGNQDFSWGDLVSLSSAGPFVYIFMVLIAFKAVIAVRSFVFHNLDVYAFAFVFSFVGAADLLATKCTYQLLRLQFHEVDGEPLAATIPACAVSVFTGAMLLLHLAVFACQLHSTSFGDALQNIPIFLGSGVMMQVVLCGSFFNEFQDPHRVAGFALGFMFMLGGLVIMNRAPTINKDKEDTGDDDGVEVTWMKTEDEPPPISRRKSGVISSGKFGNKIYDSTRSVGDLLLMKDLQNSSMAFSAGDKSNIALRKRAATDLPVARRKLRAMTHHLQLRTSYGQLDDIAEGVTPSSSERTSADRRAASSESSPVARPLHVSPRQARGE